MGGRCRSFGIIITGFEELDTSAVVLESVRPLQAEGARRREVQKCLPHACARRGAAVPPARESQRRRRASH